ncbi:MAG: carboxylesterase family protein [Oscillospiraceae bacterium]|nr:carboxylesterase family protein [Oscillospiraceae bacterium]
MKKTEKKKKSGFLFWFILLAVLFALVLEFSRNTVPGWILAAGLFALFFLLHRRFLKTKPRALRFLGWIVLLALLVLDLAVTAPPYRAIPAVRGKDIAKTDVISVAQGDLVGVFNTEKTVEVYAGIPYAQPPVGDLRWREPQEPSSWEGIRVCDHFAPMSMQQRNPVIMDSLTLLVGYRTFTVSLQDNFREPVSEDSLYLNVWKPAGEQAGLPVIFFIHGGSLMTGQPSFGDYNGESLAERGVVFVNFGYRLNVFGYYAAEDLAAESPNGTTGNYGLLDQIAALRWVKDNIAAFGGDPDNITIAGESAGSSSVNALCVSPLAKGLFRRAIAESSGITAIKPYHTFRPLEKALEMGIRIREEFGTTSSSDLRAIPAEKLVGTAFSNNSMTVDGYAIVEEPYRTYEKAENNEEALLNGFNGREADVFNLTMTVGKNNYPALVENIFHGETDTVLALYPEATKKNMTTLLSAAWFAYSHYDWSRRLCAQGKPVYEYYFTRQNRSLGDWHSGEMIYAYGNLENAPQNYDAEDRALSEIMQQYWVNFARTGDPNGEGLPVWPLVSDAPGQVLNFDRDVRMMEDPFLPLDEILDRVQNAEKAE